MVVAFFNIIYWDIFRSITDNLSEDSLSMDQDCNVTGTSQFAAGVPTTKL
jgi:hypothetical protein